MEVYSMISSERSDNIYGGCRFLFDLDSDTFFSLKDYGDLSTLLSFLLLFILTAETGDLECVLLPIDSLSRVGVLKNLTS